MTKQQRLIEPVVGSEEEMLVGEVLKSGWLSEGPMARMFEEAVAHFVGAKYGIAANSCTTAMEIALRAMEISPGDRVLIPDFTHPATADAVIVLGAKPVLVDVDINSYNMDFAEARKALGKSARAIIPVSWAGYPLDNKEIDRLKANFDILVLEDAACSLGSVYDGVKTGTMADITCFSFHPRKVITTGEGGMITTGNAEFADKVRSFKNFGSAKVDNELRFIRYGSNYKMSDILAAVGVAQMAKLPRIIERRIELANNYGKLLSEVEGIRPPSTGPNMKHIFQTYAAYVEVDGARNKLMESLRKLGIEVQIGTYALHLEPYYQNLEKEGNLERSKKLYENLLALPMYHNMTSEDQQDIVGEIEKFLRSFRL